MFVKYSLVTAFILTASTMTFATEPSLFGNCDSNGECSAIFGRSLKEAKALCGGETVFVAWRKKSTLLLLQCGGSVSDGEDNANYIVNGNEVVGLNYGRYVKNDFLRQNPNTLIPGEFGAVPVCAPANLEKLRKSTFALLEKKPNETADSYCYDVTYLIQSSGNVRLETKTTTVSANDRSHFSGPLSKQTRQQVQGLIQVFKTWHEGRPD